MYWPILALGRVLANTSTFIKYIKNEKKSWNGEVTLHWKKIVKRSEQTFQITLLNSAIWNDGIDEQGDQMRA